jgi:hypothetical protein
LDPIEFTLMVSLPLGTEYSAPKQPAKPASSSGDGGAATLPADNSMYIKSVKVAPAGVLKSDYEEQAKCSFKEQGIREGQSIAVPCILYPKNGDIANRLVPGLGAIFSRTMVLEAEVKYIQHDENYDASIATRIAIVPPLVAVFYGGMVGALMLALFRGLAPFHGALPTHVNSTPLSRRKLLEGLYRKASLVLRFVLVTFAWLVLGGVSAIMIIIVTKASTGELSPIKIEINDFIGGVLVGLLSFPVVTWLQKRLTSFDQ